MPITFSPHIANGPARIVVCNDRRKPYEDALAALGSDCVSVLPQYDIDGEWNADLVGTIDFALYDLGGPDGPAKWQLVSRSPSEADERTRYSNLCDLDDVRRTLAKRGVYGPVPGPEDLSHMTAVAEKCLADLERKLRAQQDHPIFGSYYDASLTHFYTFGEIQDKVAAAITRAAANEDQEDNAYRVATTFAQDFPTTL